MSSARPAATPLRAPGTVSGSRPARHGFASSAAGLARPALATPRPRSSGEAARQNFLDLSAVERGEPEHGAGRTLPVVRPCLTAGALMKRVARIAAGALTAALMTGGLA